MPPPYKQPHWKALTAVPYVPQPALGEAPADWAVRLGLGHVPHAASLPTQPLTRVQVMDICQDPTVDVLHGYVCAMAWGRQDNIPGSRDGSNVTSLWENRTKLSAILQRLRVGGLPRREAYRLFLNAEKGNEISDLGPSFFTKLIYFFSRNVPPGQAPYLVDNQILDRMTWLTGLPFSSKASCGGYQAACWEMDQMTDLLGWSCIRPSGSMVEERLFSWNPGTKHPRLSYRQQVMFAAYSRLGIPKSDF